MIRLTDANGLMVFVEPLQICRVHEADQDAKSRGTLAYVYTTDGEYIAARESAFDINSFCVAARQS